MSALEAEAMMREVDRRIDAVRAAGVEPQALMLSLESLALLKTKVPRKQYRKRQGTRFVNAYRGVPMELHDEWSWGWMLRPMEVGP